MIFEPAALKVGIIAPAVRKFAQHLFFEEFDCHEEIAANDRALRAARGKMLVTDSFAVAEAHRSNGGIASPQVCYQSGHLARVRDILESDKRTAIEIATHRFDSLVALQANDWDYLNAHVIHGGPH